MARPFRWTPAKEQALAWTFQGGWTQTRMAAQLGITRRTVEGWTRRKAWRSRAETIAAERQARWDTERTAKRQREADARRAEAEALLSSDLAAIQAKYGRWAR
ncbi:MAG TPA: hypothetical protein VFU60_02310 [Ktedonobacterales bacterium]|nr:hypothetical protein [Ktedonobacterales bacterium]